VVLFEMTRVSCLASAGLSGRGQAYPRSCVGSATLTQMSRGPKVAEWALCTHAHARKWRTWTAPTLQAPCAVMERCVCLQHPALEMGEESLHRGNFSFQAL